MLKQHELISLTIEMIKKYDLLDVFNDVYEDGEFCANVWNYGNQLADIVLDSELSYSYYFLDMYETLQQYGINIELSAKNVQILCVLHEVGHVHQFKNSESQYDHDLQEKYSKIERFYTLDPIKNGLVYLSTDLEIYANNFMIDHMNEWL